MDERHQQHLQELVQRADMAVQRHGLEGVRAEVVLVLDVSKSMVPMYKSRAVHELATRLLALSLEFDDDGVIPAFAFGDSCRHLRDLRLADFASWVEREVIRTGRDFQNRCRYAPAINEVCSYFFPEDWHRPTTVSTSGLIFKKRTTTYPSLSAPRALPVYALFVTGGDCEDQAETTDVVRRSSRLPIFWQFVGLQSGRGSRTRFAFLDKLDKLGNTFVDNCGFFEVTDTRNDRVLFDGMTSEFPDYLQKREVRAMLRPEDEGGKRTKGERHIAAAPDDEPAARELDTAARDEDGDGADHDERLTEAHERARQRQAAEARALSKRSARSRVDVPARQDEPTSTLAPLATRTVKAMADTRVVAAVEDEVALAAPANEGRTVIRAAVEEDPVLAQLQSERTTMIAARDDDSAPAEKRPAVRPPLRPPPPRVSPGAPRGK
ncbi:MAG: VWA domain-containing protein [Deltaproteobacteria bacterium]|nr:VWA domain-containing protein [Deltaproteobacteria bacterium]